MKNQANIKFQLYASIAMFLVSIFMSVSYYIKISNHEADKLNTFAFFVWIFSIFAWLIKVIHDSKILRKTKEDQETN